MSVRSGVSELEEWCVLGEWSEVSECEELSEFGEWSD